MLTSSDGTHSNPNSPVIPGQSIPLSSHPVMGIMGGEFNWNMQIAAYSAFNEILRNLYLDE